MKYMMLVYHDENVINALPEIELQALRAESVQLANAINAENKYVDAAPLYSAATGTCVRVRQGETFITDGPYAETREQLGGYYLINAEDLDEALAVARRVPGARIGTVEVRPVMKLEGLPER
jgi:hypothetical protein